jgi:hypothetical protein
VERGFLAIPSQYKKIIMKSTKKYKHYKLYTDICISVLIEMRFNRKMFAEMVG